MTAIGRGNIISLMSGSLQERFDNIKKKERETKEEAFRVGIEKSNLALQRETPDYEKLSSISMEVARNSGIISLLEDVRVNFWKEGAISVKATEYGGGAAFILSTDIECFFPGYRTRQVDNVQGRFREMTLPYQTDYRRKGRIYNKATHVFVREFYAWKSEIQTEELRFNFYSKDENVRIYCSDSVHGIDRVPKDKYYSSPEIAKEIRSKYLKKPIEIRHTYSDYSPSRTATSWTPDGLQVRNDEIHTLGLEFINAFAINAIDLRQNQQKLPADIRARNQKDETRISRPYLTAEIKAKDHPNKYDEKVSVDWVPDWVINPPTQAKKSWISKILP